MSLKEEQDFVTGVYLCKDPIKNFKIKVKLKKDKSTLVPFPHFETDGEVQESVNGDVEIEEKTISWQEKVFSPFEIKYYSIVGNCHTPLEEKYHAEVLALCKESVPSTRIFTYTDADNFNEYENTNNLTTEIKNTSTTLIKGMTAMQLRKRNVSRKLGTREMNYINRHMVDCNPSDEFKNQRHFLTSAFQTFYIMADLNTIISEEKDSEDWLDRSEYMLCMIKFDTHSDTLFVTPDFTSVSLGGQLASYHVEVDGDARNVYKYWLEHASESLVEDEENREEEILAKLLNRHLQLRQISVGTDFEMPRSNELKMYILGEIVCAEDFEYDDLFVHFLFDLPKGWTCDEVEESSGVTQKCRTGSSGIVYFGHLFEANLTLNMNALPNNADAVPCWPQFFAEVLSFDPWERFRVEGYCVTKIPPTPGEHCLELATWRPLADGPVGELRRFFVGGSPGLEDLSSVGIPAAFEGGRHRLSKLGLRVASSGRLHVRLHVVRQSNPAASAASSSSSSALLLERLSAASLVNSVNAVVAAFRRARERMIRARRGLDHLQ